MALSPQALDALKTSRQDTRAEDLRELRAIAAISQYVDDHADQAGAGGEAR